MLSSESPKATTFRHLDSLPHLPVPKVDSTAQKYLRSILPLVSPQEPGSASVSDAAPTPAFKRTKAYVEEFLKSPLGKELKDRLKESAEEEGHKNWLSHLYSEWDCMEFGEPMIPFLSYYVAHKSYHGGRITAKWASELIHAITESSHLIETHVFASVL
ncbi:hypothetical protein MJO28_006643 [Puccinia striiformis f. sp. tritici]|uniref:Choline/carnitine acyltransferase domain-containing protein n=3 Tax=Puccinia striiformis TaxID=27350 RepID=A0A2S4UAW2_9BASI|nr:hypothetical protein MJO28_006643 [Puccinia striiformis f. sp. tritici]KAI7958391.1 hypothetical protein MJO29_006608 [Puccinia striiformis f. sp. tritici]POV94423.1 hypothetical protein PSTT_16866 [Puccinia striiformis]POW05266.1 hypothetical protein PSHT_10860 [Puccinia striiformis]